MIIIVLMGLLLSNYLTSNYAELLLSTETYTTKQMDTCEITLSCIDGIRLFGKDPILLSSDTHHLPLNGWRIRQIYGQWVRWITLVGMHNPY